VKHQFKWRAKSGHSSSTDLWVSSSEPTSKEEIFRPVDHDRAKATAWKGKEKAK
jgi:hypothetical protein